MIDRWLLRLSADHFLREPIWKTYGWTPPSYLSSPLAKPFEKKTSVVSDSWKRVHRSDFDFPISMVKISRLREKMFVAKVGTIHLSRLTSTFFEGEKNPKIGPCYPATRQGLQSSSRAGWWYEHASSPCHLASVAFRWGIAGKSPQKVTRNQWPKGVDPSKIIWLFGLRKQSVQNGVNETPPVEWVKMSCKTCNTMRRPWATVPTLLRTISDLGIGITGLWKIKNFLWKGRGDSEMPSKLPQTKLNSQFC